VLSLGKNFYRKELFLAYGGDHHQPNWDPATAAIAIISIIMVVFLT